jgi:hypothetical protein
MNHTTESTAVHWDHLLTQATCLLPPPFGHRPGGQGQALAAPDAALPTHFAFPPDELVRAHDPALLLRLWARLLQIVREPTQTIWTGPVRWVQVVGGMVVAFRSDGTVEPYGWVPSATGGRYLEPLGDWTVILHGSPYRQLWLQALARLAAWDVQRHAASRGDVLSYQEAEGYAQWAFQRFARLLVRHADLRQMRARIARTLAFDPGAVAIAARLPTTTRSASLIVMGAYNRVLRHRAAFDSLQRESPNLVPIFGALCEAEGFPAQGQPAQRLRQYLVGTCGLSPRCWRYLGKAGGRALKPLATYYRGSIQAAALAHLQLIDQLGLGMQSPRWLANRVVGSWGDPGNRWGSYGDDLAKHGALWAHITRSLSRPGQVASEGELDLVGRWIGTLPRGALPDGQQRGAGWPWLVQQANTWAEAERLHAQSRQPWSTWTEPVTVGRWELRPLNSALALWQEALAMRHCVDRYGVACQSGRAMIFAVHEGQRHVATAMFTRTDGGWELSQARGFANAAVPASMEKCLQTWAAGLPASEVDEHRHTDEAGVLDGDEAGDVEDADDADDADDTDDTDDEEDETFEEEDPSEQNRRVIALACDLVHGGVQDPGDSHTVYLEVEALLDRWNDQGDLSYRAGGRQVLHDQVRNWTLEIEAWLQRALDDGYIDEERFAVIGKRRKPLKALRPEELAMFDEMFVEDILGRDAADYDVYGSWGAECLRDEAGREAWAIYRIKGYSFTSVELSLLGLCGDVAGVKEILEEQGRYSGDLPR